MFATKSAKPIFLAKAVAAIFCELYALLVGNVKITKQKNRAIKPKCAGSESLAMPYPLQQQELYSKDTFQLKSFFCFG